ncbi:sulfur carrier protein ThiS [Erwinia amylovora]|nr:sulfur carrier protein ThiS [Erwinia amylovora]RWS36659.1 sulfur carrier protein ThiS [Erwinia amylovora]
MKLNGSSIDSNARTLVELQNDRQIDAGFIASAVNGQFVPRSQYDSQPLTEGCALEVLAAMPGG